VAGALAVAAAILGWRGADVPNHQFRIELFRRAGFTVWSSAWYGGHHTPGYSVLLPPLGAVLGPAVVGALSAVVAAVCFDRLVRALPSVRPSRAGAASLLFAAGTVTNLAVGRLAFALGLAIGLAALVAGRLGPEVLRGPWRLAVAVGASAATALASPVAGCFLALAWTAGALRYRSRRCLLLAAAASVPMVVLAGLFPEGGTFSFRAPALVFTLAACTVTIALLPPAWGTVRIGAGIYAAAALVTFAVPNPLGANITRLGMFFLAPVLVAGATRRRLLVVLIAVLVWWQWSPAADGMVRSGRDPSTEAAYYAPLLEALARQPGPIGRIEIPFTQRHFEAAFVAPSIPIARGWERQVDMRVNPLFYARGPLDPARYRDWLDDNGVEYVALPDAALDPSAQAEAHVIEQGQPFLRPVWRGAHWRVWRVVGSPGLVDGPAALVGQTADTVTLDAWSSGTVVVRVRATAFWSVDGPACAGDTADGWVRLEVTAPGRLVLHPVLLGYRARCPS
jgi:hypothetical protein